MRYTNRIFSVVALTVLCTAACSRDPQVLKVEYLRAGDDYMKQNKVAEAIISYRNAVAQDAMYAEARVKLALAYEQTGDKGNAMREAIRAADLLPQDVNAQVTAGKWLLMSSQFQDARTRAVNALAKEPKNVEALILLGNSLVGLQDLDGAIEQIEEAIELDPKRILSYSNLGFLQAAKGNRAEAETSLRRAVAVAPDSVFAHLSLANFLWAAGNLAEAEASMRTALALQPASVEANKSLATVLVARGRVVEAEPFFKGYSDNSKEVGAKLVLADYYFVVSKQQEALATLNELIKMPGGFALGTLRLAAVAYKEGRHDEAFQLVEEVLKQEPRSEDARLAKARFLINQERSTEALPITEALVKENDQSVGAHLLYASALEGIGDADGAIDQYKKVLQLAPSSPVALTKLSDLYFKKGDINAAAEFIGQIAKNQPNSFLARFLLARSLIALENLPRAEAEVAMLVKARPQSAPVQKLKGDLAVKRRQYAGARAAYQRALELDPTSFDAFTALVGTDLVENKPEAARKRIEDRLAATPNDKDTQMLAGNTFMRLRDTKSAEASYRRVIELDASAMEAYAQLGNIYMSQNRLDEARMEFEKAAEREPTRAVAAKTMVGVIYTMQNRHTEAKKQYEGVLQIDPAAAVASNNLAYYHAMGDGSLDLALNLAQTAKSRLPKNSMVNDTLGWIYYKKGMANLALPPLQEGVKSSPEDPILLYHLGMTQVELKQTREARASLEKALKLKSDFEGADTARQALASLSR